MKDTSTFKLGVTIVFGIFIVVGVAVFALSKSKFGGGGIQVVVWGTLPNEAFDSAFKASSLNKDETISVKYEEKDELSFDSDFVEALAEGNGPDVVILRDDSVYKHRNKILTIPYKNIPERTFKDKFIEGSENFLTQEGVVAVPLIVDPLVMYWNRDIFSNNALSQPPKYWDQIYELIDKVTKKDAGGNVLQSAIALGESRNITNSKEILSMLLMQAGSSITKRTGANVTSVLNTDNVDGISPAQVTMDFYTQFSNPTSNSYTWNRSLPTSLNMFLGGNLALYIGFASEIFDIQQKNPNLNFDVTYAPQTRNTNKKTVFGHFYSMSITKQSLKAAPSLLVINALTEAPSLYALEASTTLPPVRRDMLAVKQSDAFRSVFYDSAIISHSWIDPDPQESGLTFRNMVESITSGKSRVSEAIIRASTELNAQLK